MYMYMYTVVAKSLISSDAGIKIKPIPTQTTLCSPEPCIDLFQDWRIGLAGVGHSYIYHNAVLPL